jgi:hypothetical protein
MRKVVWRHFFCIARLVCAVSYAPVRAWAWGTTGHQIVVRLSEGTRLSQPPGQ